ncbi:cob(I)yrinic acid a,c-diamide adenosyltransferase [Acidilutibacter cellobiosedens]|jgi:cob(I)alamin adenosyltransferase|uniref:Cob(I)yrinic acid a,c-diamide adenosyltransferase n=1 Tax=Acidilutibacter cellobiosedens TaxID=2507161 RepID=A0A410Q8U9_9FIRM|nr:cob(I)yrinic acid a,c-diamide adenosyltransferase [Acidilutibacter cellobiosedens]MBE6083021.1 cob(I)yrinic acid a,c-diamide adenosyltransferase [Tissierellaceae bacterium]QAT60389.1 cob(I)yrinic acid a,c-diamide adenosyltransferase [Acidilutibacter cellobiosedens]
MEKGYVHVYTGNGKGKTTAALGLSLRAVCAGKKVYFGQFIKGMKYSELESQKFLPNFEIHQFGRNCFIFNKPTEEDIRLAKEGLETCRKILSGGLYDIVVLDELNIAVYYNLFTIDEAIEVIKNRVPHVEVIVTGRYADEKLIEFADLVTEMKEIKHYYKKGVPARKGIEN